MPVLWVLTAILSPNNRAEGRRLCPVGYSYGIAGWCRSGPLTAMVSEFPACYSRPRSAMETPLPSPMTR